jgi:transcriptional regulator with XRE-family HTH domain
MRNEVISRRVAELISLSGVSRRELGRAPGLSEGNVRRILKGGGAGIAVLEALATAFRIPLDVVLGDAPIPLELRPGYSLNLSVETPEVGGQAVEDEAILSTLVTLAELLRQAAVAVDDLNKKFADRASRERRIGQRPATARRTNMRA